MVNSSDSEFETGTDEVYVVYSTGTDSSDDVKATFKISSISVKMLIDSGSACNILRSTDDAKLIRNGATTQKCNRTLRPYNSPPFKVQQCLTAQIDYSKTLVPATFLILPNSCTQPSLLGKKTTTELGVLQIHLVSHVTSAPPVSTHVRLDKYTGLSK